jgi:hypothetical protein
MVKPVKSNPLMVTIAEKVGTTVGLIVAKTTGVVDGASKMVEGAAKSLTPSKSAPVRKAKPVVKRKTATVKKKVVKKAVATVKRKSPAKKTKK